MGNAGAEGDGSSMSLLVVLVVRGNMLEKRGLVA